MAITSNISQTVETQKEETPAPVETPVLTEKKDAAKEENETPPAETNETAENKKTVETATSATIIQYSPSPPVANIEETKTKATETDKTETVMKCPQIIPPPKTEEKEKPEPNNNFVEELEERNEERERERQRAIVKMMLNSLPPNWSQEQRDRALKEFLKVMKFDKYP